MLHHPVYAGAYTWGRRRVDPRCKIPGRSGTGRKVALPEQCQVFLRDRCPAYITRERYEANQRQLADNQARGNTAVRSERDRRYSMACWSAGAADAAWRCDTTSLRLVGVWISIARGTSAPAKPVSMVSRCVKA